MSRRSSSSVEWPCLTASSPGGTDFTLDFDAIEARDHPAHASGSSFNDLHNPTGAECSPEEVEVSPGSSFAARPHGALRRGLLGHSLRGRSSSMASLPGMAEHRVILYTFSKKFAMTGWRLGWGRRSAGVSPGDREAQRQPGDRAPTASSSTARGGLTGDQSGGERNRRGSSRSAATRPSGLLADIAGRALLSRPPRPSTCSPT